MVGFFAESKRLFIVLAGRENLVGAANHWRMVILLRPYFFQVILVANLICITICLTNPHTVRGCDLPATTGVTTFQTSGSCPPGRAELDENNILHGTDLVAGQCWQSC